MKITFVALLSMLLFQGSQLDSERDQYIGKWVWVYSEYSGMGPTTIIDPSTYNVNEVIEITANHQLKVYINGVLKCEEGFELIGFDDTHLSGGLSNFVGGNCFSEAIEISNDTLKTFKSFSCPPKRGYYVKMK